MVDIIYLLKNRNWPRRGLCAAALAALALPCAGQTTDTANGRESPDFARAMQSALIAFNNRNYADAAARLDDAERYAPHTSAVANLRGLMHLDRAEWADAAHWFNEAIKISPQLFAARFNLTEIPFRQKKYDEARAQLQELGKKFPKNELVAYTIFLCYLLQGDGPHAEAVLQKIPFPGLTPAYYYAHAAWELARGQEKEAWGWINPAQDIFSEHDNDTFIETLYQTALLKQPAPAASPSP